MPAVYSPRDRSGLESVYQEFMERTRYLRRGDYVFTDRLVVPLVVAELGSAEHLDIRMLTSFIRHHFELDVSHSEDTVAGVEIGLAPNYPFLSASVFSNYSPPPGTPDDASLGFGAALNMGWRDLGWSLSTHLLIKRRDLSARGNLEAVGLAWGLNPFYFCWQNDSRGRIYSHGYHVNFQAAEYKKACLSFNKFEVLT